MLAFLSGREGCLMAGPLNSVHLAAFGREGCLMAGSPDLLRSACIFRFFEVLGSLPM